MSVGVRNFFRNSATQTVTASTALVAITGLSVPVSPNQTVCLRYFIPFTVGATGGFKFQLVVPAAGVAYTASLFVEDGVTALPGQEVGVVITASAAFANAFASVAGNHLLEVNATIVNGVNAGNIDLQFACNSAAGAIIILSGASVDVVKL